MPAATSTLGALLHALNAAFVELLDAPNGLGVPIASVALVDADDLAAESATAADLYLLAGVRDPDVREWLDDIADREPDRRPAAIMTKIDASGAVRDAARTAGVAVIAVHSHTRWDRLLSMVRGVLDHVGARTEAPAGHEDLAGTDTDLFGLAHTVASLTRAMVSIEDERAHVLAYSASDDQADELRTLSILGREGPVEYLRRLEDWGVYDRLRRSDEVVEVPAHPDLGIRRRFVTSIRGADADRRRLLGTLWIQEGGRPIAEDAEAVLRGAAAVAARLITQILAAPTNEALQIQRLIGARGGGVDVPSLASALSIPTDGSAAVIGIATADDGPASAATQLAPAIRLHASSFHRTSLVTTVVDRVYVVIAHTDAGASVSGWTRQLLEGIEVRTGAVLRAAVATPVAGLAEVASARAEVDRVLDGTVGADRVTTLADSRTSVLLGEILDLVGADDALRDPRVDALIAYDAASSSTMRESVETYLRRFGDVRAAAADLHVHPNTLRYRIRRVEEIIGSDLTDPAARLLLEVQLAVSRRRGRQASI